ncbi:MAG TPA: nucleotidyltransferase family protein [Candidatus Kapabacteria bacterium]|nr:nucleotidyltransferase family protein [Candidatus Kapabacteria bacterium]
MDGMIFAAGLGTRLRPLTDALPKALIEVGGIPMLERVARQMIDAGVTRLIVNAHHHAGMIEEFVAAREGFGIDTVISSEAEELLDTGGGLWHAARFFRREAPFLLHNGDIYTDMDLRAMYAAHPGDALATLAVMRRDSARYLLFDSHDALCGYGNGATGFEERAREPVGEPERMGFCGVHVISPRIFDLVTERGAFSIIPLYMRLVREGERIGRYDIDGAAWIDIGRPEQLALARADAERRANVVR